MENRPTFMLQRQRRAGNIEQSEQWTWSSFDHDDGRFATLYPPGDGTIVGRDLEWKARSVWMSSVEPACPLGAVSFNERLGQV